ncbi:hypothetical protein FA95DRAFT_1553977 [Auriscalpium vulgare]|uniref:Uncharacterized protein n=1 Tax=Auriscalpium vulgare TaxID=40419 RepID=A0ACB8S6B0_9AGAM|nr:hypothetical protein FA95DRAFT_1553977 [Auriscalpium vulgare]
MRSLTLHVSALNDDEYDLFTSSLTDLVGPDEPLTQDAHFEKVSVSVREARAWLRGRYADLQVNVVDEILRMVASGSGKEASLSGGQFFAVLRLVLHVRSGAELDRNLVFSQVHPHDGKSDPPSPTKPTHDPPPRHVSTIRSRQVSSSTVFDAPTSDSNPFAHLSVDNSPQPPVHPDLRTGTVSSPTIIPIKPQHHASNPFVARAKTLRAAPVSRPEPSPPPLDRRVPPLPPRKPPPLLPPRTTSLLIAPTNSLSAPAHAKPPAPPPPAKVPHLTTALMKQSLQASKAAQDAKRLEAEREQARVLQVLKSSAANGHQVRSSSPRGLGSGSRSSATSPSSDDRIALIPPTPSLPPRRYGSPPPSSALSTRSFEQVASAAMPRGEQASMTGRRLNASPSRMGGTRSPSYSPSRTTTDLPPPPPVHPDRKTPTTASHERSPSQSSPRVGRSKSMHYSTPPPVPPPLNRRRPESVQLPSPSASASSPGSLFTGGHSKQPSTALAPTFPKVSRHLSLSARDTSSRTWDRDRDEVSPERSPMMHFQKTLSGLGPRLDAARFKAEAGLNRRGYGRWREDAQQQRLVSTGELPSASSSEEGLGMDESLTDGEDGAKKGDVERDDMKWPAGDGWKPL